MLSRARRVVDAARSNLPPGTIAVGIGVGVNAIAAYAFQIIAAKKLPADAYNAINSLWVLAYVATPGFLQPLEQEVSRAMADRRAKGQGGGPILWKAVRLGALLVAATGVIVVGVFVAVPETVNQLFKPTVSGFDHNMLIASFVIGLATYAAAYLARGALSGNGRFGRYGLMLAAEGVFRLVALAVVLATTSHVVQTVVDDKLTSMNAASTGGFGLALVVPPLLAVGVSLWRQRGLAEPGPDASYSELSSALAWLLASSVMAQVISYAPVFAAEILVGPGEHEQKLLSGFVTAMYLARVPLLSLLAIQAALLPKLAASAAAGKHDEFRSGLMRLAVIVVGVGVIGVIAALVAGEPIGQRVFPDKWTLSSPQLALLALGFGGFMVAFTLAQGLIALKGYAKLTAGWAVGSVAFVVLMPFGDDVFLRAEIAFLVSSLLSAATITVLLLREMRTHTATLDELVETIVHEPFEL